MNITLTTEPGPRTNYGNNIVILDTSVRFSDAAIKRAINRHVIVDSYPDYYQLLLKSGTKTELHFRVCEPIVLDGRDVMGPKKIRTDGSLVAQRLRRLKKIECYTDDEVDITVTDCKAVTTIHANYVGKLTVDPDHKKSISFYTLTVREMSVPQPVTYFTRQSYTDHTFILPKKLLASLYSLHLTIDSQEELDKCEPDAFNVNILIIDSRIPNLDLTRFVFSNVTTLELQSEPDILFSAMDSLISWTSPPLIKVALLDVPRLMYLFVIGYNFPKTKEKIYEHADLYIRGLYRKSLKMDVRSAHRDVPHSNNIIDVEDLLAHAESMMAGVKSSANV